MNKKLRRKGKKGKESGNMSTWPLEQIKSKIHFCRSIVNAKFINFYLCFSFRFLLFPSFLYSFLSAQPLFTEEVNLLPLPERKFGVGWALLVEFIAATHYQTNLNNTAAQQSALPPRMLKSGDKAPFIPDLIPAQNRVLLAINLFHSTNVNSKGLLLKVWRRVMCSPKGRAVGRGLLESINDDPWIIPRKLFKLLWGLVIYPCKSS